MQELITISKEVINKATVETVNARELHEFLESKQQFSNWIQNRIEDYEFNEDEDFLIILFKSPSGRPTKEYHISLDMAKELSMVERNEKGKQARHYFIECMAEPIPKPEDRHSEGCIQISRSFLSPQKRRVNSGD